MGCLFTRSMAVALVLVSGAAASAQSLADVARREEERRKSVAKAGKVYTNDQLPPAPPVSAPRPASRRGGTFEACGAWAPPRMHQPATRRSLATRQPAPDTDGGWVAEARGRRSAKRLSRSQILADALQSRINALTTDFENRGDPAQRSVIFTDRQKALAELDRVKKEIAEHQKAITTIQEEARRAGVPAGWTR